MTPSEAFLSTLPDNALSFIVRHCSSHSDDDQWQNYIGPKTMKILLRLIPWTVQSTITEVSDSNCPQSLQPYFRSISILISTAITIHTSLTANAYHVGILAESVKRLEVDSDDDEEILAQIRGLRGKQLLELHTRIGYSVHMRNPFPNLTSIRSLDLKYMDLQNETIEMIARNTCSLEDLKVRIQDHAGDNALQEFVSRNALLRKIAVCG